MRFMSYRDTDGALRAGIATPGGVIDLHDAAKTVDSTLPSSLLDILSLEHLLDPILSRIMEAMEDGRLASRPTEDVTFGPVLPRPGKLLCLAGNYQSHLTEAGGAPVDKAGLTPRFFIKPGTSVTGTGEAIVIPPVSDTVDYEIEIAAVIGRRGRDISEANALRHVTGYTVFNDISARQLKGMEHRTTRPMDDFFDWLVGKWCDSFAVVGPFLVTPDEIGDPGKLEMSLWVNGELRQHSSAGEMIFTVPEAIAWISRFLTLEPGDMICMGTPGGVGVTTQTFLKPGDTVVGRIEMLGTIENHVA